MAKTSYQIYKEKRAFLAQKLKHYLEEKKQDGFYVFFQNDINCKVRVKIINNEFKGFLDEENIKQIESIEFDNIRKGLEHPSDKKGIDTSLNTIQKAIKNNTGIKLNALCVGYLGPYKIPDRKTHRYNAYNELSIKSTDLLEFLLQNNIKNDDDFIKLKDLAILFSSDDKNQTLDVSSLTNQIDNIDEFDSEDDAQEEKTIYDFNVILFGAPGTGKSYQIEERAKNIQVTIENIIRTTFHPEYSYFDFVGQYKPVLGYENVSHRVTDQHKQDIKNKDGFTKPFVYYDFVPGAFTKLIIKAIKIKQRQEKANALLIIEEINRGNCAAIFGDIFQLLDRIEDVEKDDYGQSEYHLDISEEMKAYIKKELNWQEEDWLAFFPQGFIIPSNVFIYATMNTSDQSLFPMDAAFKRRWSMEYISIDYEDSFLPEISLPEPYADILWVDFIKVMNQEIVDYTKSDDKQLGQWFVKRNIDKSTFRDKILAYLWQDVFTQNPSRIFKAEIRSYNDLVRNYSKGVLKNELIEQIQNL